MTNKRATRLYIVLVFGARDYKNKKKVYTKLDNLDKKRRIDAVLHGGASGADSFGESWANKNERISIRVPAEWTRLGKAAGPIRNRYQAETFLPDLALGFHYDFSSSRGTKDMCRVCEKLNIVVKKYWPKG